MKYLLNIFITYHENQENWKERIEKFSSLNINWYQQPTFGHHLGYACQGVLDTDNEEVAVDTCEYIKKEMGKVIIVFSKIDMNGITFPIGECNNKQLVKPGRFFDELVSEDKFGIYLI